MICEVHDTGQIADPLAGRRLPSPTAVGGFGGQSGRAGAVLRDGQAVFPKGKLVLEPGQQLVLELPGGGGWGNANERPHELIERDLREGLVSAGCAKADYGYSASSAAGLANSKGGQ